MEKLFFDTWQSPFRILLIGAMTYVVLIVQLRVSGKRTLSKMNAFDFIVTVALGSTLATVLLSKDAVLLDGAVAFGLLIFLQYVITWLSVRYPQIDKMVKAQPRLLLFRGKFLWDNMKAERITEDEILAALRSQGIARVEDVGAVVLETEGNLSVLPDADSLDVSTLANVQKPRQ